MHVRPSLLFSLLVPSALLAGSAVAATRSGSNSTACLPASLPATGTATAPAASQWLKLIAIGLAGTLRPLCSPSSRPLT